MENNSAILLLGSNIEPEQNILAALRLLSQQTDLIAKSRIWETEAIGSSGPNFLNMAIKLETVLDANSIKSEIITPIENKLKRVRTEDKYASRTIDIDIIIYNGEVMDPNLWEKAFIALPVSELMPDIIHPENKLSLNQVVKEVKTTRIAGGLT